MNTIDVCNLLNIEMDNNSIGENGEDIAKAILGSFSIFRVVFLGDKNPITDFYAEIAKGQGKGYPFLVQVKTTMSELDEHGRLHVAVPNEKYQSLCQRPIPTYVAGVDLNNHTLFIRPAFDESEHVSFIAPNMVISFYDKLDCGQKLQTIQRDVITYWESIKAGEYKKSYQSIIRKG